MTDYTYIALLICFVTFYARGARAEGKSPIVWGALSLGSALLTRMLFLHGIPGLVFSQLVLFVGIPLVAVLREGTPELGN